MSKRKTGRELEHRVKAILEKYGYQVHLTQYSFTSRVDAQGNRIIRSFSNDIFNCIDLVAIKPNEKTLWIQVTADHSIRKKLIKLQDVNWNFDYSRIWLIVGRRNKKHKQQIIDRLDIYDLLPGGGFEKIGHIFRGKIYLEAGGESD